MRANRGSDFRNFSPRTPFPAILPASHCPVRRVLSLSLLECVCVCVTKPWPRSRTPFPSALSCRGLIVTLSRIYLFIYSFVFCSRLFCVPLSVLPHFQFVFQFNPHKMQIMFSVCYTFSPAQSQIATDRKGLDWIRSRWVGLVWFASGLRLVLFAGCLPQVLTRFLFDFCIIPVSQFFKNFNK